MEKKRNDNEEIEIDLLELLMVMKKHLAAILLAGIVGLVIMFACTTILIKVNPFVKTLFLKK